MLNKYQQAIPEILDTILGHPENYSAEQLSCLETGLHALQKETQREEEKMQDMNDVDCNASLLQSIDVA
ncbi:hypothetical protein EXS65_03160 [Candidatus Peribacteria bacterium]|nr:hypothetical protein [Candidatus Peribacteria bacterium]